MNKFLLVVFAFLVGAVIYGQKPSFELSFSAIDDTAYIELDSIKVMNLSNGSDTTLFWPDTVLVVVDPVSIEYPKILNNSFNVFQNTPNPVKESTNVNVYIPEKGKVEFSLVDITGSYVAKQKVVLEKGLHKLYVIPGKGSIQIFNARWQGIDKSIKMINSGSSSYIGRIEYIGSVNANKYLETKDFYDSFPFQLGDELLYIVYYDTLESGFSDTPLESMDYTLQFAFNIPCPGLPSILYGGQVYNTVQIFNQCWLKENLNIGVMVPSGQMITDNGIIEKRCYEDELDSCNKYGGLYYWDEMMNYGNQIGATGICPVGWHIPTDLEWKILEGAVDSEFKIGDPEWNDGFWFRGTDAGKNLKTSTGWKNQGNGIDTYGFAALPSGFCEFGHYIKDGENTGFWTSTDTTFETRWYRDMCCFYNGIRRWDVYVFNAYSVRCIRN